MNTGVLDSDAFLYDVERLEALASEEIIRRGIAYFKENRVTDMTMSPRGISASVEGSRPDTPYFVNLSEDGDGELLVECDCPFDWEPVCKHAVSVLLAYEARAHAGTEKLKSAADMAIAARAKRGRTEVRVEHVAGQVGFGTWRARSLASPFGRNYEVQIRSVDERRNACTCPDFSINYLGTCKHIEAVLHRISALPETRTEAPLSFVYLDWDAPRAPLIKLQRSAQISEVTKQFLARWFAGDGVFKGSLPEDFHHLEEDAFGCDDLLIGKEVRDYNKYLAEAAVRELRGRQIFDRVFSGSLPGLKARLYPYQVEGVAFLAARGRALLADDMGLGKTLQSIAAAVWLTHNEGVQRTLVICPASLKAQWAREIAKFTEMSVQIVQGNPSARLAQYRTKAQFTIVNYELVLRDVSVINEQLGMDLIILDEAQRLKNWRTKIAAAVKLLRSSYLFVLSGTPLENRLEDLYSLLQLIDSRILGPLWRFIIDFHVTDERGKILGYRNLSELRRRIEPVMKRRDRRLVRDQLPDRIEQRLDIPMGSRQRELHDEALSSAGTLAAITKRRPLTPSEEKRLLASLQQARMACNAAGLVDKETVGSPKLDELENLLRELCLEQGLKAVVFSQWERMTAMAEETACKLGLGTVRLHGGVPTRKRGDLLDRFRTEPAVQVFISTDAGGVGLNLQEASVLINLEMPWNPAVLRQRIARVHRLGQNQKVQAVLLVSSDSYEQRVAELLAGKQELFDNVIDENASEDVVGITKKTLDTLVGDLVDDKPEIQREDGGTTNVSAEETETEEPVRRTEVAEPQPCGEDLRLRELIERVQKILGTSLECILGTGASLLAVVDRVEPQMEAEIANLDKELPVALIDSRAYHALQGLGKHSPLAHAETILEATPEEEKTSPFMTIARRKLKGAEALLESDCPEEGVSMVVDAMIAAVCGRARVDILPARSDVPVWLYATGLKKGWLTPDEAASITKAYALADVPQVPGELAGEIITDATRLVASLDRV